MKHVLVLLLVCVGDLFSSTTGAVLGKLRELDWQETSKNAIHGNHVMNCHCRESMYEAGITEDLQSNAQGMLEKNRSANLATCIKSVRMPYLFNELMAFKDELNSGNETGASLGKETLIGLGLVDPLADEIGPRASQLAIQVVKQLLIPRLNESSDYKSFQSKIVESLSGASTSCQKSFYKRLLAYYSSVKCLVTGFGNGYEERYDSFLRKVIYEPGNVCSFVENTYQRNGKFGYVHTGYNINVKLQEPMRISCYYTNLETRQWSKLEDDIETSYVCINLHKNDGQIHSMYPVARCVYQNPLSHDNATFCLHLAEELGIQDDCVEKLRGLLESSSKPQ